MAKRHLFWVVSIVLVIMGLVSLFWQGKSILGIEFSSGTQAMLKLKDDALVKDQLPNDGLVRTALIDRATAEAQQAKDEAAKKLAEDFVATARVETVINDNRVEEFLKLYGDGSDTVSMDTWAARKKDSRFFELIDTNKDGQLDKAELEAKLPDTTYQISTTVTNVKLVRNTADGAFGPALQRRVPCTYDLATSKEMPQLGIRLASTGATRISGEVLSSVTAAYRDEVLDYDDGVLFVVEKVTPALTAGQLQERIRDIRLQPDFGPWAVNPYKVLGVTAAGNDTFSTFAVLVRPADPAQLETRGGTEKFLDGEADVLKNALKREDPIVIVSFDAAIAGETAQLAIVVVVMSWLAIVAYLWLRFGSVQWGLAAVVCLVHDVIIVVGLVAASGWIFNTPIGKALGIASFKIDLAMVAALLTVIGYSVNDTIVIFDRIRENRGKLKTVTGECINDSINQTLPRTLLTSFTTFLVVFIMYVWGGPGIKSFSYALLMGIIFGTYSSVAVASPLLLGFKQAVVAKIANSTDDKSAEA
jgi:SecD/SecF fusion protein